MNYFGTDLDTHGHYVFKLNESTMVKTWLKLDNLPFDPEGLTRNLHKGEVVYYNGGGYTVIGISGSCKDDRAGTKSIFWVREDLTFIDMYDLIHGNPMAIKILASMSFFIRWNFK